MNIYIFLIKSGIVDWGYSSVVEHLPYVLQALDSVSHTAKAFCFLIMFFWSEVIFFYLFNIVFDHTYVNTTLIYTKIF